MSVAISGHSGCSCGAGRPTPLRTAPQRETSAPAPAPANTTQAESSAQSKGENETTKSVKQTAAADRYTPAEKELIEELKARDREVRSHEAAHKAAAGALARGGPSYTYQRGPDGAHYAVGGEVQIDLSAIPGDPQATLRKAEQIRAAALAPAQPSSQDYAVAARATQMAAEAQRELNATATTPGEAASGQDKTQSANDESQVSTDTTREDSRVSAYQHTQGESFEPGQLLSQHA